MEPSTTAQVLVTPVLFLVPGLLAVAMLGGQALRLRLLEQSFVAIGASILVSGWCAFLLVELGLFTPERTAGLVLVLVVAVALWYRRRLVLRPGALGWDDAALTLCLVGFALLVYFPPFEYILGGKDPGVYANSGFHVARAGNLLYTDPLVRDLPPEARGLFFRVDRELPPWTQARYLGFYLESPETGRVLPQGFHLYPVWMGVASSLFQMRAGLYATPFFMLMGVVGLFMATRRLFDAEIALWAAAFLCTFQLQVWFARFPNAESVVQFLFGFGLLAFYWMQEKRSAVGGFLAGAAIGSILLVRLESILFVIPVGLYMVWARFRRRAGKSEIAFLVPFVLLGIHSVIHATLFAAPYVGSVFGRWYWSAVARSLPLLAVAALVGFLVLDRFGPRLTETVLRLARRGWVPYVVAAVLFLLACYGYFVRPIWHGPRTAPHDAEAFLRMSWYLYPIGVALAVAGIMQMFSRPRRIWGFFLLVGLTFSLFFFYKIRVSNDHFFGMRRFIPIILPSFFIAIAYFLAGIKRNYGRLGVVASTVTSVLLLTIYLLDGRPLWSHNEFRGSLDFVEDLARHIGDEDIVIFPRREGLHLLEPALAELEGRKVLEFYTLRPERERLESLLNQWRGRYNDVFFVTNYKVSMSGLFTRHVKDFLFPSEIYEYTYLGPPKRAVPFHLRFTLSKAVDLDELSERIPELSFIDVGGANDEALVAWFHGSELENGVSYRWTERVSSVFLPHLSPEKRELALNIAGPPDSAAPLNEVSAFLNDHRLGTFTPGRDFEEVHFSLPEGLLAPGEHAVLRLETTPWRPSDVVPGATDIRDLGARLDWIEVR